MWVRARTHRCAHSEPFEARAHDESLFAVVRCVGVLSVRCVCLTLTKRRDQIAVLITCTQECERCIDCARVRDFVGREWFVLTRLTAYAVV
jgi:hypothetical protein